MGTKQENAAKREADVEKLGAQLKAWSTQLDDLVAGYLRSSAQESDPYRVRVDALQARKEAVQHELDAFNGAADGGRSWTAFRTAIKEDWRALQSGFKDLTS
ncbi:MAG: hypothetical protein CVU56_03255 [Deltaproteobacteria bacterium HGW-Deltaproteobacteria-14]|jgi:hypothetical protein|nr:MAG: hypothetical protein CVU56_03255 [Deltaproteobacteria bacterium HGW-Deltaproteobacteria-14]